MSAPLDIYLDGLGLWTPGLPDWPRLRGLLRGEAGECTGMAARPAPACLPASERRRAPAGVLLALEVAAQAVTASGHDAAQLPCLFVSAHGDGPVLDYLCEVQARAPAETSPTRFHNSVHNAAAGYWTIASGCHQASCAASALEYGFGAGLLEAASQVLADNRTVLLVISDIPGTGPLGEVIASSVPFGCALVLAPARSNATQARLALSLSPGAAATPPLAPPTAALASHNLAAHGLPLLESLAGIAPDRVTLAAADGLGLTLYTEIFA